MKVHTLHRKQRLAMTPEQAWQFFSTPHNLQRITPDFLHFRITSRVPEEIHAGLVITYRIAAVAGIPMTWVTEIKHVERYAQFVDEQRIGPFRFWHHLHRFRQAEGGIEMEDVVHYVMPWGWFGHWVHRCFIGRRLQRIFDFRRDYLDHRFNRRAPP
jgi:ligand-binding SRPBCC domain-containing protein